MSIKIDWVCVAWCIIISLFVLLFLVGCNEDGRVGPSRRACSIYGGSDGIRNGWFVYIDAFGEEIQQEGVRMNTSGGHNACYFKNNGLGGLDVIWCPQVQHIESTGITEGGGRMTTCGVRDDWGCTPFIVFSEMTISKPDSPGTYAKFYYRTRAPGSEVSLASASKTCDRVVASTAMTTGNYTSEEYEALDNQTDDPPENGIEYTCTLIAQNGRLGNGTCKSMSSIMAVNLTDPNDYLKYSSPFMYSYVIKTAEPITFDGIVGGGRVMTDVMPDGKDVTLSWYGSNIDGQTHVFRTEPFLLVDSELPVSSQDYMNVYNRWTWDGEPNLWDEERYDIHVKQNWLDFVDPNLYSDPNIVPDPNVFFDSYNPEFFTFDDRLDTGNPRFMEILIPERIIPVKIIPLAPEDDYVRIGLKEDDLNTLVIMLEYWLSENKVFDLNGDGIVNYADF